MIKKLTAIHRSRVEYKNRLTEEQERRLAICKACVYNSDNSELSFTGKFFKSMNNLLNKIYGVKVTEDAICNICKCNLELMSSVEEEENKCKLKKW